MTAEQDELKTQLKQQAEALIERVWAGRKPTGENSLRELEELAVESGGSFEELVMQSLIRQESEAEEVAVCERCQRPMENRGLRQRRLVTTAGEVEMTRRSYWCPGCGARIFPPG